ncbi:probable indole-3-pyruvate monooxygenase YUCCA10 [Solanum tuberosum]|uniref:probable indole-3-pyruvate monooxygenase YUCCA10 n=1 Tax=Solanum tuberosum TaxID=4113 RepID=UPI00073A4250|nr:PREDICTED: probable indole-3-pyruvate monooxygenase YUCCA10 [Solanum tuberosum]
MDNFSKEEVEVVVVGAGPSGIAVTACLNKLGIKNIVLEKEDCCAYLWKKKTYDRLHLHLSKDFCSLPFMPHATSSPKYLSKNEFIQYLDEYVRHFNIKPKFQTCVELAFYNNEEKKWNVQSRNVATGEMELYACNFLILATGENNESYIPKVVGIENFNGKKIHSSDYKSGEKYKDKKVLVIGSGNSGMEIAFDLSNYGSHTSIVCSV